MSLPLGQVKVLWPYTFTSTNNKLRVTQAFVDYDCTFTAGTYYAYWQDDYTTLPSGFTTDYPSLYEEIKDTLETVIAGSSWTWERATPALSSAQTNKGAQLRLASSALGYDLAFSDASNTTADPRLFGYEAGRTTDVSSVSDGGDQIFEPDLMPLGVWHAPVVESDFRGPLEQIVGYSTDQMQRTDAYAVDYGSRKTRRWVWEYVPAAHVYEQRASLQAYADTGDLSLGDGNNALELAFPAIARADPLIIVPVAPGTSMHLGVDHTDSWSSGAADQEWELVRLDPRGVSQPVSMTDMLETMRMGGEYYRLTLPLVQMDAYTSTYTR